MKECTICMENEKDRLEKCPVCKQVYCKIHLEFHLSRNNECKKIVDLENKKAEKERIANEN